MRLTIRTVAVQVSVFLCFQLLCGCGGGGGSSPTEPRTGVFFTPDHSAGGNSITLRSAGVGSDTLELEIYATDISDLQAITVAVVYPNDLLRFDGYREGSFLSPSFPVTATFFNSVLITQPRVLPAGVSGSGTIGVLSFTAIADGSDRIDFGDPQAIDSASMEIDGVDWIGGDVEVAF